MIENTAPHAEEEEISIEITDEPVEGQGSDESEDELDRYTKSVSKRINKLNRKNREAEARAQQLEQLAHQKSRSLLNTVSTQRINNKAFWLAKSRSWQLKSLKLMTSISARSVQTTPT